MKMSNLVKVCASASDPDFGGRKPEAVITNTPDSQPGP